MGDFVDPVSAGMVAILSPEIAALLDSLAATAMPGRVSARLAGKP